jgi:D-isomer specific 2-hydroxyacid dehydrogenase, catalytic domain
MSKIVCVLYDDPVDGNPKSYARSDIPKIDRYPGGQALPTPSAIDFKPGVLLGSVSGELGLRKFLESQGHTLVVTSDKDGPNSVFERELVDAEVIISQPFWPAYLTAERIAKAKKLKLAITAGIGSDHVDLQAAMNNNITVTEVTLCSLRSQPVCAVVQHGQGVQQHAGSDVLGSPITTRLVFRGTTMREETLSSVMPTPRMSNLPTFARHAITNLPILATPILIGQRAASKFHDPISPILVF